jgi:hypothetical protein
MNMTIQLDTAASPQKAFAQIIGVQALKRGGYATPSADIGLFRREHPFAPIVCTVEPSIILVDG